MLGGVVCSTLRTFLADNAGIGLPLGIERVIGIGSFMQNKPNLLDARMNVNKVLTRDYENIANSKLCENKPNTKPIYAIACTLGGIKANFCTVGSVYCL